VVDQTKQTGEHMLSSDIADKCLLTKFEWSAIIPQGKRQHNQLAGDYSDKSIALAK